MYDYYKVESRDIIKSNVCISRAPHYRVSIFVWIYNRITAKEILQEGKEHSEADRKNIY